MYLIVKVNQLIISINQMSGRMTRLWIQRRNQIHHLIADIRKHFLFSKIIVIRKYLRLLEKLFANQRIIAF